MNKNAVMTTELPELVHRGKVRDTYRIVPGMLLMIATDRISAFDVVMNEPIAQKGVLLAQMSSHWFRKVIGDIVPNHMIAMADDEAGMLEVPVEGALKHLPDAWRSRSMVIKEALRIDIECVVRGYLAGSGWAEYESNGTMNSATLPLGFRKAERFDEPVFTPSTKASEGHDEPLSETQAISLVGRELYSQLRDISIDLYLRARDHAAERGMILVDTKFEFGYVDEELTLIDEVLTPDSSRFWDANEWSPGTFPPPFDKQFLREWLMQIDWNRESPPPEVPPEVIDTTRERYISAFERLTDQEFLKA